MTLAVVYPKLNNLPCGNAPTAAVLFAIYTMALERAAAALLKI